MRCTIITLIFVAIILSLTFCLDRKTQRAIDRLIKGTFIPHYNITGMGLTIVKYHGQSRSMVKGYGFRDIQNGFSANADTIFAIGSLSKSFTAVLIAKTLHEKFPNMAEDRSLDIPIKVLVPSIDFTLSDRFRSESVTLRDLMSHTTGLMDPKLGLWTGAYKNKQEVFYRMRYSPEIHPFRTQFLYNNGGPILAGEVIAAIANRTIEDMFTDLFGDIGMHDTRYIQNTDDYNGIPNMSKAYYRLDGQNKEYNRNLLRRASLGVASGGVLSTPNDMSKYLLFHLNNGRVGSKQIVPQNWMQYLRKCSIAVPYVQGKMKKDELVNVPLCHGVGVSIGLLDGWQKISHGGYIPPFSSYMSFYPDLKLGIFTTTNGPGVIEKHTALELLHKKIFSIVQKGRNYKEMAKIPSTFSVSPKSILKKELKSVDMIPNEDIVGVYGNGLEGEFTISNLRGTSYGNLYLNYGTWETGTLFRNTNSTFILQWDSDLNHDFYAEGEYNFRLEIDFSVKNTAVIFRHLIFVKNLILKNLPSQPWDANSCGSPRIS